MGGHLHGGWLGGSIIVYQLGANKEHHNVGVPLGFPQARVKDSFRLTKSIQSNHQPILHPELSAVHAGSTSGPTQNSRSRHVWDRGKFLL